MFCEHFVLDIDDEQVESIETISTIELKSTNNQRMINDSDSDFDDFNYVINESERQLIKARISLEKKKEQAQPVLSSIDRYQRKYVNNRSFNVICSLKILFFFRFRMKFYELVKRILNVFVQSLIIFINLEIRV